MPSLDIFRPPRLLVIALFVGCFHLIAGCSGGTDTPVEPQLVNPGGIGTQTLRVVATVQAVDDGGTYRTEFRVSVTDAFGLPVSEADVRIQTPNNTVILSEQLNQLGTYWTARSGYTPGTYVLSVVRGGDQVSDVAVTGPDVHLITRPNDVEPLVADQSFEVEYTRSVLAQEVLVETRDYRSGPQPDTGRLTVPASGNPPRDDQRVRVVRKIRQVAEGGLPDSAFETQVPSTVEPIVSL